MVILGYTSVTARSLSWNHLVDSWEIPFPGLYLTLKRVPLFRSLFQALPFHNPPLVLSLIFLSPPACSPLMKSLKFPLPREIQVALLETSLHSVAMRAHLFFLAAWLA